jgi:hypothetical protein
MPKEYMMTTYQVDISLTGVTGQIKYAKIGAEIPELPEGAKLVSKKSHTVVKQLPNYTIFVIEVEVSKPNEIRWGDLYRDYPDAEYDTDDLTPYYQGVYYTRYDYYAVSK